jgi:hypothetical protein
MAMKIAVTSFASFILIGSVSAQTLPDIENGRYALSPVADGVVRLDTRTGAVTTCSDKGNGWACTIIPDERAAYDAEIGRLFNDNAALRAELAQRGSSVPGKSEEALPKQDSLKPKADGERKLEIPLPSDKDIDRAMSFVESAWRKLIDIATRLQRDSGGKI